VSGSPPWKVAWITGASSGIGRELALLLAHRGVNVAVTARSAGKLDALAAGQPGILAFPADVTDDAAMRAIVPRIVATMGAIDLAVLNAGTWEPVAASALDPAVFARTMDVNYLGVVRSLAAVLPVMQERRAGRIAIVSSVAGYRGLPKAGAYGPSKAALISLAESLAPELGQAGIGLSLVNPGFVATPLTAKNDFPMPFMIAPEDAARRIVRGLERGRFEIAFPWQLVTILKLARILPYPLFLALVRRGILRG
jgi:NAD(P)-dependent dehydrogenase (short-subunit alcohol dehydrogenase family)